MAKNKNTSNETESMAPSNGKRKSSAEPTDSHQHGSSDGGEPIQKKPRQEPSTSAPAPKTQNSAVYVMSIPLDANEAEIAEKFRPYGMFAENIKTRKPRITMYPDKDGNFKGEALVVYFRPESVALAVQMLDDVEFRLGQPGPEGKMTVMPADLSFKKHKDENPAAAGAHLASEDNNTDTRNDADIEKRKKAPKKIDRRQAAQVKQELNDKLADWGDGEISGPTQTSKQDDKVVVLRHMFTLEELATDPEAAQDIEADIRELCEKLDRKCEVILFDGEREGVIIVRFNDSTAAAECVRYMHGRYYGGQHAEATLWDGETRFLRATVSKPAELNDDESKPAGLADGDRLKAFNKDLERRADNDD